MTKVVEILQYRLQAGSGERFHRIMQQHSIPLHVASGLTVLDYGVSLDAPDAYYLLCCDYLMGLNKWSRYCMIFTAARPSLEGPRTEIMALIEESHWVVLPHKVGGYSHRPCEAEISQALFRAAPVFPAR